MAQADLVFQLPVPGSRLCLYEDGTEVTDDCFPGLPSDAELLLLTAGETLHGTQTPVKNHIKSHAETPG